MTRGDDELTKEWQWKTVTTYKYTGSATWTAANSNYTISGTTTATKDSSTYTSTSYEWRSYGATLASESDNEDNVGGSVGANHSEILNVKGTVVDTLDNCVVTREDEYLPTKEYLYI